MKFTKTKSSSHFPDLIPACYHEDGKFIVPEEWQLYYVRLWKWKLAWGFQVEPFKAKFLTEYETKNGKIVDWVDHTGALRPIKGKRS